MMLSLTPAKFRRGAVLFECILAVMIFSIAMVGLAKSVENCMRAERFRREDALASRALANYLVQIEAGAIPLQEKMQIKLEGAWQGMMLNIARSPITLQNEKEQEILGLYQIDMQLTWTNPSGEAEKREMTFILYPRQQ